MLADRVGAEHAEDMWREADPKRLQTQIKAAVPFKDLAKGEHTHAALNDAICRVGVEDQIPNKEGVQRCVCGAVRVAIVNRAGEVNELSQWALSGYLVDYLVVCLDLYGPMTADELSGYNWPELDIAEALTDRWANPMTFSEAAHLYETLPGDYVCKDVPADWNRL